MTKHTPSTKLTLHTMFSPTLPPNERMMNNRTSHLHPVKTPLHHSERVSIRSTWMIWTTTMTMDGIQCPADAVLMKATSSQKVTWMKSNENWRLIVMMDRNVET